LVAFLECVFLSSTDYVVSSLHCICSLFQIHKRTIFLQPDVGIKEERGKGAGRPANPSSRLLAGRVQILNPFNNVGLTRPDPILTGQKRVGLKRAELARFDIPNEYLRYRCKVSKNWVMQCGIGDIISSFCTNVNTLKVVLR